MIKRVKGLFLTAILTVLFIGVTATHAKAETYLAGEFTITLDDGENGKTYRSCDAQGKCINLENGTSWRDNGYRGITWENGDYTYSVSWRENANEGMYLNIYNKDKQILRHQLVETTENIGTLKGVTYCDVVNITSGQLALRDSPNGQSSSSPSELGGVKGKGEGVKGLNPLPFSLFPFPFPLYPVLTSAFLGWQTTRAGLDNGNNVLLKKQEGIWAYVSVVQGPNTRVNGLSGWVNSNYLHCTKEPID